VPCMVLPIRQLCDENRCRCPSVDRHAGRRRVCPVPWTGSGPSARGFWRVKDRMSSYIARMLATSFPKNSRNHQTPTFFSCTQFWTRKALVKGRRGRCGVGCDSSKSSKRGLPRYKTVIQFFSIFQINLEALLKVPSADLYSFSSISSLNHDVFRTSFLYIKTFIDHNPSSKRILTAIILFDLAVNPNQEPTAPRQGHI